MGNEWDDGTGNGRRDPGPQFDSGEPDQQGPSGQQWPPRQGDPHAQQGQYPQDQYRPQGQFPQQGQYPQPGQSGYPGQNPTGPGWSQQQQPYGPGYGGYAAVPAERSSMLGIIGLVVVLLAMGALIAAAWSFGSGLTVFILDLAATGVPRSESELMNDPRIIAYAESVGGTVVGLLLSGLVGLVGWIISIVATATRRGRVPGIIGIVLGVLSVPIAYAVFNWALAPALALMGS